jgi:hypothetical protein
MSDSTGARQPTEAELRAYLERLRAHDAAELLAEAYNLLGTAAQVKLGRPDARVLIDAMAAVVESTAGRVADNLHTQMRDGVNQLKVAQVQAEREVVTGAQAQGGAEQGQPPGGEPGQAPAAGAPSRSAPGGQQAGQQPDQRLTDRLWIPGREPPGRP